jgi:hypothetical protein
VAVDVIPRPNGFLEWYFLLQLLGLLGLVGAFTLFLLWNLFRNPGRKSRDRGPAA